MCVVNYNAHATPGHSLLFFLCWLSQPLLFADTDFSVLDGPLLDLAVCNFAGVMFKISIPFYAFMFLLCKEHNIHLYADIQACQNSLCTLQGISVSSH